MSNLLTMILIVSFCTVFETLHYLFRCICYKPVIRTKYNQDTKVQLLIIPSTRYATLCRRIVTGDWGLMTGKHFPPELSTLILSLS
jgi:hypothetical protein